MSRVAVSEILSNSDSEVLVGIGVMVGVKVGVGVMVTVGVKVIVGVKVGIGWPLSFWMIGKYRLLSGSTVGSSIALPIAVIPINSKQHKQSDKHPKQDKQDIINL